MVAPSLTGEPRPGLWGPLSQSEGAAALLASGGPDSDRAAPLTSGEGLAEGRRRLCLVEGTVPARRKPRAPGGQRKRLSYMISMAAQCPLLSVGAGDMRSEGVRCCSL